MDDIFDSNETDVVVIGAGISGLFVAHELLKKNFKVTILEKSPFVGGLSTSLKFNDSFCDIGPHFVSLVEKSPISDIIENFLDSNSRVELPDIHNSYLVFFNDRVQKNLPTLYQFIFKFGKINFLKSFLSYIKSNFYKKNSLEFSTENYLKSTFGNHLFFNWFRPYLLHTYGTLEIPKKTITEKFPPITFKKILKFIQKKNNQLAFNEIVTKSYYPKFGMQQIITSIHDKIIELNGNIILNANILEINHNHKKIIKFMHNNSEKIIRSKKIVYSIPPKISINWFKDSSIPTQKNSSLNTIIVFLIFDTDRLFDGWIINIYDPDLIFFRLSQQNFLSTDVTPKGKSLLTIEIKCSSDDSIWKLNDEDLLSKIQIDLKKFPFPSNFSSSKIIHLPSIYPIPSKSPNNHRRDLLKYINSFENEYSIGTIPPDVGRFASTESTENISLGGFNGAIQEALSLVNNIVSIKNDENE